MRSEGYSSCPVCVSAHTLFWQYAESQVKPNTIVLSVEIETIVKGHFSLTRLVQKLERFYLPRRGQPFCLGVQFMCNVSYLRRVDMVDLYVTFFN